MTVPCVGIVWGIDDGRNPLRLVTSLTPLSQAEPYGDCLTHSAGHHDVWENWRGLGSAGLARKGLPTLIAWHEYEHFPRGRVVFHSGTCRFTLYADRKLQARSLVSAILHAFCLDPGLCDVRADLHYRSPQSNLGSRGP